MRSKSNSRTGADAAEPSPTIAPAYSRARVVCARSDTARVICGRTPQVRSGTNRLVRPPATVFRMTRAKRLKLRTDEELRLLSDHVLWHVKMLFGLSDRIEATALRVGPSFSAPEDAALLESFAVHARALIEFFWKEGTAWPEDGRAVQFFNDGEWAEIRRPMEATLDTVFERASWGIVHISFKRVVEPAEASEWRFTQVAAAIGRCLQLFIQNVPDTRVSVDFKSDAWHAMPHMLQGLIAISRPEDDWPGAVATPGLPGLADASVQHPQPSTE